MGSNPSSTSSQCVNVGSHHSLSEPVSSWVKGE